MMLVLAVRTDAERVYQRALAYFTPDEIAEAFAAARGIASPTQLRTVDEATTDATSLAQFRALAPARRPISLQTWGAAAGAARRSASRSARRARAACNVYGMFTPAELPIGDEPTCGTDDVMILMAQAVPTATAVPCVAALPGRLGRSAASACGAATARFWLDSDRGRRPRRRGDAAAAASACDVDGASEVPSDETGIAAVRAARAAAARRCASIAHLPRPTVAASRTASTSTATSTHRRWSPSTPRSRSSHAAELVAEVDDQSGLTLCGAGAAAVRRRRSDERRRRHDRRRRRRRRRRGRRLRRCSPSSSRCSRCGCSASAAAGARRCSPASSAGASAVVVALGAERLGLGRPTGSSCTSSPSASRRRWPSRSASTCSPVPARWPSASAPGSSSPRGRCAPSAPACPCSGATASWSASLGEEGFGPFRASADRVERSTTARPCGSGGCSRRPAACT